MRVAGPEDTRRDARSAAERESIRNALVDLCFEVGYRQIKLPALLERAGVDEPAFHRQFTDVEDCACQVYVELREEFFAAIAAAVANQASWRDRVRAAFYALIRYLRADDRNTYFGIVEIRTVGERAQLLQDEAFARLFDLIDAGRQEHASPAVSRATSESIVGGIFNQIYTAVGQGIPIDEELVPNMVYLAIEPYLGHEAAMEELVIAPPPPPGD
jgi:AcrR family transcriptional regulator